MAGLLAWAADVVAGNGSGEGGEEDGRRCSSSSSSSSSLYAHAHAHAHTRLSAEEQEEVRMLDGRAVVLQQQIRKLRQQRDTSSSSPHGSGSDSSSRRRLPHDLHADSLAAHSALTSELNAHQATQKEAQNREASLLEENAAYAKAITSVQKQIQEKAQERRQLESHLQELEKELTLLNSKLVHIENSSQIDHAFQSTFGEGKVDTQMSSSDKALMEGEELQRTRAELKTWEDKLAIMEQEWRTLVQNSTKLPSSVQREKNLERRLRSLAEQLVSKQAQADSLTKERLLLERQLRQATETRRQLQLSNADSNTRRTKAMGGSGSFLSASSNVLHSDAVLDWRNSELTAMSFLQMGLRQISVTFQNFCVHRIWNKQIGFQLLTNTTFRALIVAYILSLHVIAYAVISFAS